MGAHFTGRNETPDRIWETRSEVVAADRGRAFFRSKYGQVGGEEQIAIRVAAARSGIPVTLAAVKRIVEG